MGEPCLVMSRYMTSQLDCMKLLSFCGDCLDRDKGDDKRTIKINKRDGNHHGGWALYSIFCHCMHLKALYGPIGPMIFCYLSAKGALKIREYIGPRGVRVLL